jgi:Rieske Fe-S protein
MPCDRRDFVRIGAGMLAVFALDGCATLMTRRVALAENRVEIDLRQFPELEDTGGAVRLLPDGWTEPFYLLALEGGGYAAISPICTHLECTVEVNGDRLVCPCHGSTFDREGQVLLGPAERPLRRFPVQVRGEGVLVIDVGAAR